MEVCVMTVKNPPKFGKKKVTVERELPHWIPKSDAHTKVKVITLKRKLNLSATAKSQQEAETKIGDFLSQLGLEILSTEGKNG